MARERTTISLDGSIYSAALAVCAPDRENRDFSNLVEVALREFLSARGALPGDAALKAELLTLGDQMGLPQALKTLRGELRTNKPAA